MTKDRILVDGTITDILPSDKFKVKLDNGFSVICYLSGRMRVNKIRIIEGDRVEVELSEYDLNQGRITYRY